MTRHRDLNFRRFVAAVPTEMLERYFRELAVEGSPSGWAMLNGDALEHFLNQPENDELDAIVRRDFRRINDLCDRGQTILGDACRQFAITFQGDPKPEEVALRIFLDDREAWAYTWGRYMFHALGGKLSVYPMDIDDADIGVDAREAFEADVRSYLVRQGKGGQCRVHMYRHMGQEFVYVERGTRVRTVAHWQGEETEVFSYRPALDDLLVFDVADKTLKVKTQDDADRVEYVRLFAKYCAGDELLTVKALGASVFTLAPVRDGDFDFGGDSEIVRVDLVGIRLKVSGGSRGVLDFRSADVFKTMAAYTPTLSLRSGELALARFRFYFSGTRRPTVTLEVAPPCRTDLPDSVYSSAIERYLKRQGVKLL